MAATPINNLDALDTVPNIDATEEEILKAAVKAACVIVGNSSYRAIDLFIGQMEAEGFDLSAGDGTGISSYVQSPTVRVENVVRDGRKPEARIYTWDDDASDWAQFGRGVFPVFLHPGYPPRT